MARVYQEKQKNIIDYRSFVSFLDEFSINQHASKRITARSPKYLVSSGTLLV